jgi:hypothetical protein
MFRIDDSTAASSLPAPETAGAEGFFTEGNPVAGTPATNVRGSWLNMIQEELRAFVVAGGLTPSKTTYTQVRDAALALFHGMQKSFTSSGSFTVPAGVTTIYATGCAAGGGGASGSGATAAQGGGGGSGGSAGQPAIRIPLAVSPGNVIVVTIGAAGTGGAQSASGVGGSGGISGGNTIVTNATTSTTLLTLNGGSGGAPSSGNISFGGVAPTTGYPSGSCGTDAISATSAGAGGGAGGAGASGPFGAGGGGPRGNNGSPGITGYS